MGTSTSIAVHAEAKTMQSSTNILLSVCVWYARGDEGIRGGR